VALTLLIRLAGATPAAAQLSHVDLVPRSGDAKITFDAATGLYWLDLTETVNLSVPDIGGGSGGWIASGWRYATPTEICNLFAHYALAVQDCGSASATSAPGDHVGGLQQFVGVTAENGLNRTSAGFYDDGGDPNRVGIARLTYQIPAAQSDVLVQQSATFAVEIPSFGNWLVRRNSPPVANAGPDQSIYTDEVIRLFGTATDADGDAIVLWSWYVYDAPPGSIWQLFDSDRPTALFEARTSGDYVLGVAVVDAAGNFSATD
jgi:hypothetical protein